MASVFSFSLAVREQAMSHIEATLKHTQACHWVAYFIVKTDTK